MKRYIIIAGTPTEVEDKVWERNKEGFLLHGYLTHLKNGIVCQAMIHYEPAKEEPAVGKVEKI